VKTNVFWEKKMGIFSELTKRDWVIKNLINDYRNDAKENWSDLVSTLNAMFVDYALERMAIDYDSESTRVAAKEIERQVKIREIQLSDNLQWVAIVEVDGELTSFEIADFLDGALHSMRGNDIGSLVVDLCLELLESTSTRKWNSSKA